MLPARGHVCYDAPVDERILRSFGTSLL